MLPAILGDWQTWCPAVRDLTRVLLNVELIRRFDHVLLLPRQADGNIQPLKAPSLDQCLRLGMVELDEIPRGLNESIRKGLLLRQNAMRGIGSTVAIRFDDRRERVGPGGTCLLIRTLNVGWGYGPDADAHVGHRWHPCMSLAGESSLEPPANDRVPVLLQPAVQHS
jgi:hypothetical protein